MPYTEGGALKRRLAFWDNTLWKLHQLISDIEVETASNWPKERDAAVMKQVLSTLNLADYEMLRRYREVLGDKLEAMQVELEP
jgi:hypothetical protein